MTYNFVPKVKLIKNNILHCTTVKNVGLLSANICNIGKRFKESLYQSEVTIKHLKISVKIFKFYRDSASHVVWHYETKTITPIDKNLITFC